MNANELRLGNWVHPQFPMQVVSIYNDEILCNFEGNEGDVWEFNPKDLDGILLSYQWLANFGFKKEGMHQLWKSVDFWVQETQVGSMELKLSTFINSKTFTLPLPEKSYEIPSNLRSNALILLRDCLYLQDRLRV
jgi:hypothetical protein